MRRTLAAAVIALSALAGCADDGGTAEPPGGGTSPTATGQGSPDDGGPDDGTTDTPATDTPTTDAPAGGAADGTAPEGDPDGAGPQAMEAALFERLNDERQERGLEPLAWDDALADVARQWSEEMAERGAIEHQDLRELVGTGDLEGLRALGENVFSSTGATPAGVAHVGWMESDGHRSNMLQPGFDRVGIGVECTDDGGWYATQQFGRTQGSAAPSLEPEHEPPAEPVARPERQSGPTCDG